LRAREEVVEDIIFVVGSIWMGSIVKVSDLLGLMKELDARVEKTRP